jgi:hypothetical protein
MRIFILTIPQMIRIHFRSQRMKMLKDIKDINILANYGHEYNDVSLCSYDATGKREFRLGERPTYSPISLLFL